MFALTTSMLSYVGAPIIKDGVTYVELDGELVKRHPRGFVRQPVGNEVVSVLNITAEDVAAAPSAIDWSQRGALTPIKDQGQCGSCWAFSTTEGVESAVFMAEGKLPAPLSTEELVNCDRGQDGGCDGGDLPTAARYYKKHGVASAAEYPDHSSKSGRTGKCTWDKKDPVVSVSGFSWALPQCNKKDCSGQDEEKLAAALAKYGPLSICVNSGDGQPGDWDKYKSGVWKKECKAKSSLTDHCVQLVGYDKGAAEPYWKIRNSWGTDWGEGGFIRLAFGNENMCCVGCEAMSIAATSAKAVEA